jgi:hypothetical protein
MTRSLRSRLSFLCSVWLTPSIMILPWILATSVVGIADKQCSFNSTVQQQQFHCPNPNACPESGYSLVSECLDCDGYLSLDYELNECFDRKLLSRKGNLSQTYFYRDLIGIVIWFVAAGVGTRVISVMMML